MKKLIFCVITILLSLTFMMSCKKSSSGGGTNNNNNNNNNNNGLARILIAGYDNQGYPVMYDGNTKVNLDTNGKYMAYLGAISIDANDIYLTSNGGYWKNGVWYSMWGYCQSSTQNTQFSTVFVKGNNIYVAGRNFNYANNNRYDTLRLWKNGVQVFEKIGWGLREEILNVNDQGDYYLNLSEYTSSSGTWPNSSSSGQHSIYKNSNQIWFSTWSRSGSSVSTQYRPFAFFNGTGYNVYTLLEVNNNQLTQIRPNSFAFRKNLSYTNNEFTISPTSTSPYYLYYSGSCYYNDTCYISGYESGLYNYGKYWKNGEEHILFEVPANLAGHVGGIDVKGTTVYVAGRAEKNSNDLYWKNGIPVTGPESFECLRIKVY